MLKEVFTRSSCSACLHNMVAVFSPYPSLTKKKSQENPQENSQQVAGLKLITEIIAGAREVLRPFHLTSVY